ncbi:F-box/LRR-repeat protein 15-like [Tetranychus urticae]|uniref:F-box/LRR-repeat protein 15-like leucin rich repeat domain-containing protein n=1 Tax=Tetranychus urticae TaxID=32264 RepID=T1JTM9_TETUR|nr:F-box/LRR-repeat protein 15-like [Tetranychus urticae]XP_025018090.1 F-box/LRR-repeat protein 15-like [Tetranychus urticae]XP_025018091.1 F-box/LRR-repeat protein 15-like [Tetranychus urticae]XP_025018092.1 F-box/LRR-repeat protein 15-like [Tetranychus urticae]XP_025018093.1 F-box/LRR-repeat protein 15-like [Tetranychus urticae]XP_025018096.1 F-box/LRR-repeat protein 15-like [Tetranychus urticae]
MNADQPEDDQENQCDNFGGKLKGGDDLNTDQLIKFVHGEDKVKVNKLLLLPWDDVLFPYILDHLTWKDLYLLRSVSRSMMDLVHCYLSSLLVVDLAKIGKRFTLQAFGVLSANCYNLRILNLYKCKWISNDLLQNIIEQNPHLTHLNISCCLSVNNNCLQRLAINCKGLKSIQLKECCWTNAIAVAHLALNCPLLEEVDLTSCWEITDDSAIALVIRCPNLRRLSLSNIYGITDSVLMNVAAQSKNLEYLNISGCWHITDYGVRLIGENCKKLERLEVFGCSEVTERSLAFLRLRGVKIDIQPPQRPRLTLFLRHAMGH